MGGGDDNQDQADPRPRPPAQPPAQPPAKPRVKQPAKPRVKPPVPTPPAPPPLDEATARAVARLVSTFVLLILASLATAALPLPWRLGSLTFTLAGLVVGVLALRRARRSGVRDQLSLVVVFGIAFSVLTGLSMAGTLILWPVEMARQECLDRAVTIGARAACETAYEDAVQSRLDDLMHRP